MPKLKSRYLSAHLRYLIVSFYITTSPVGNKQISIIVVENGWYHGEIFYCQKCKEVYQFYLRKIKTSEKFKEQVQKDCDIIELKRKIDRDNFEKVKKLIETD